MHIRRAELPAKADVFMYRLVRHRGWARDEIG